MYCSTCGAAVPAHHRSCGTCGTPVARGNHPVTTMVSDGRFRVATAAAFCPRCAYHGEGITYFSRGSHIAALVGTTLLTAGAMGAGGLIYYLLRRDHRVCPRCGRGWGRFGERALAERPDARWAPAAAPSGGASARIWSVLLFAIGAVLLIAGIADGALAAAVLGVAAGAGGFYFRQVAARQREERRSALLAALQLPVLKLAAQRGGTLTVTDVVAELGWTIPRAEKVLFSLDDGVRVSSDVTDEGVIVFEFREVAYRPDRRLPPE